MSAASAVLSTGCTPAGERGSGAGGGTGRRMRRACLRSQASLKPDGMPTSTAVEGALAYSSFLIFLAGFGRFVPHSPEPGFMEDDDLVPPPPRVTKLQKKKEIHTLRHTGKAFVNGKGQQVPAREVKPFTCTHKSDETFSCCLLDDNAKKTINEEYWSLGSHDMRAKFVSGNIISSDVKRKRKSQSKVDRKVSWQYNLDFEGKRHRVCRGLFMAVLCETDRFLRNVAEKKLKNPAGFPSNDQRGRKPVAKRKLRPETKEAIKAFIKSVPSYVSHYCRQTTGQTKYLASHLNKTILHQTYLNRGNPKVSYSTFRRVFNSFKLKFKKEATDTCATCDEYTAMARAETDPERKMELLNEHQAHLKKAQDAYDMKHDKVLEVENDDSGTKNVLIFDLEQCLPSPDLATGKVYYKRQMYTFNLTIVDIKAKKTYCYMWHENEAGRGSNEIASCLFKHIMTYLSPLVRHLCVFSDCCSGQNRNNIVAAALMTCLQEVSTLETIEHIFLVPGHTRLECDSKHSIIERYKSSLEVRPMVPMEWYNVVQNAGKDSFEVVLMGKEIYDFHKLLLGRDSPLVKRKKTTDGRTFLWGGHSRFRYARGNNLTLEAASLHDDALAQFETLDLKRKVKGPVPLLKPLLRKLPGCHPISTNKKKDLLSILSLIDNKYHQFYKNLFADDSVADVDPDLPYEGSDEEELD